MEEKSQQSLKESRKVTCGHVTRKTNQLRALMESNSNVLEVRSKLLDWEESYRNFGTSNEAYCSTLSTADRELDQSAWFTPKNDSFRKFREEVIEWLRNEEIQPEDSVSQAGSKSSHRAKSSPSVISSLASRASSARMKAEAKKAELMARATMLKRKQELENQEQQLRQMKEQFELQTEIAVTDAKTKVYEQFQDPGKPVQDGMNDYYMQHAQLPDVKIPQVTCTQSNQPEILGARVQPHVQPNFQELLQQQNDITKILIDQHRKTTLPSRDIPTFNGDPLEYRPFVRAFEHGIEDKTESSKDRLYYLEQFTSGEPNDLVRSCMHMEATKGYRQATEVLRKKYGDEYKIARAYIDKAMEWPSIKSEDSSALESFSIYLNSCYNAMADIKHMVEMDHPSNLKAIVAKLPYKLRERWRTQAHKIMDKQRSTVRFGELVAFIDEQVKMLTNPLFGDITDDKSDKVKPKGKTNKKPNFISGKAKSSSFATTVSRSSYEDRSNQQSSSSHINAPKAETAQERCPADVTSNQGIAFTNPCLFCSGEHTLEMCQRLRNKPHADKIKFLKSKGLCFGCLETGHLSKYCPRRLTCKVCQQRHVTVLHLNTKEAKSDRRTDGEADNNQEVRTNCVRAAAKQHKNSMGIVPVQVRVRSTGRLVRTYAFVDNGSSATFCTSWLAKQLNVQGRNTKILLHTMSQTKLVETEVLRGLDVCSLDGTSIIELPEVFTQENMPVTKAEIPRKEDLSPWPYLAEVDLPQIDAGIGMLIGNNVPRAMEPWQVVNSQEDGPYAIRTLLGWVINGPLGEGNKATHGMSSRPNISVNRTCILQTDQVELNQQLADHFNRDFSERSVDDKPEHSREDHVFMKEVKNSVKLMDGHYQIGLPFRSQDVQMPNNRHQAEERAVQLKRKLKKNAKLHHDYKIFVEDIITKGYAQKVPLHQLDRHDGRVWYIPHHGIYHPKKPEKIRVVYDCSASFQGTSLNDQLLQGPDLTNSLVGVLTRFRQERVAFMADIEAMYYQVRVPPSDYDVLRFLWWPEGNLDRKLEEFRMTVHLFGAVSSPSCANYALKKTAEDNEDSFDEEVINTIRKNFYVDDCLKSVSTDQEAMQLARDLKIACAKGGFRLTKWISNSRTVLVSIPEKERAKEVKDLDLNQGNLPIERALGVQWCVESDKFKFRVIIKDRPATRRGILSVVSSIYDPLGLIAPFILVAKTTLQDLCRMKYGWDDEIKERHLTRWRRWLSELPKLANYSVDRCLKPESFGAIKHAQIHVFSDASETGYGCVAYLRLVNHEDRSHCAFLMGKSRVAPLKKVTIPRMELTAATVSVRVSKMLEKELDVPIEQKVFWTDSMTVLRYINNETTRFHTFVANRVAVIHEGSEPSDWRYVGTELNPADGASRGMWVDSLSAKQSWIQGPDFLWNSVNQWPEQTRVMTESPDEDPEVRKQDVITSATATEEAANPTDRLLSHFSNWTALKKAVCWILKVKSMLRETHKGRQQSKVGENGGSTSDRQLIDIQESSLKDETRTITVQDLEASEKAIITFVQHRSFPDEIHALETRHKSNDDGNDPSLSRANVKRNSPLRKLDPMFQDGLLKVGGRLYHAALPEETKHPIILPKDAHISRLIVRQIHEQEGHAGRNHVLASLRQTYWLVKGNSVVRKVISQCINCRRYKAKAGEQKMADLPADRLIPDEPPFTRVGVDYFGPFEVKRGRSMAKRYGVIFTCLATRAIHIEIAHSLDTDSCINALRRFISRRGQVRVIRSDNGTNLVAAEKELKEEINRWNQMKIHNAMLQRSIDWIFNPPAGSHYGGVWERQIRTVRKILRPLLREQVLDDESLQTLMSEVEAIVNSRPITRASDDPNDLEALTPNHLLLLKGRPNLPPGTFSKEDQYARRRWRQVQYLADVFWRRWSREYLPLLQERQKWIHPRRNLAVGDIVLMRR